MNRLLLLAVVSMGTGCEFARVEAASSTIPIMLTKPAQPQAYDVVGHFKIESAEWRGSGSPWEPTVAALISAKVAELHGDAAINVAVSGESGGGDECLSLLTLGFASRTTTVLEGDAIKFK